MIAFEGVEGAGKSTQLHLTAESLRERGHCVVETREPGGTALGAQMRRLLMHEYDHPPAPFAELFLYLADRAQHIAEVIGPSLAAGQVVLTDRFSASTIAYQGYARGLDLATVVLLDERARQGVSPDLTLILDCPAEAGLQRAHGDDRFHRERLAFHERVRHGFLTMAKARPDLYRVVDATAPSAIVRAQILEAVLECLNTE
ncbi:MAG: dTMP kinase [Deltaproteobacteria bacterium]|nr:dTMP kinase [Deltaproteobacteria bacterium]